MWWYLELDEHLLARDLGVVDVQVGALLQQVGTHEARGRLTGVAYTQAATRGVRPVTRHKGRHRSVEVGLLGQEVGVWGLTGVLLEGESEDADLLARDRVEHAVHDQRAEARLLVVVHLDHLPCHNRCTDGTLDENTRPEGTVLSLSE